MSLAYPDAKHADTLEVGAEFLDFVMLELQRTGLVLQPFTSKKYQFAKGESLQGWEVKYDERSVDTKRLSIEVAEKSHAKTAIWTPSGIYRKDNTYLYIQGNYKFLYIFSKKILIELHRSGKFQGGEIPTLKKFYLPLEKADKWCVHKLVF